MDIYSLTDAAIGTEIGARLKAFRLRKNLTQQQLATSAAVSLNVIKALEGGKGKLSSLIAVLRELGALDGLDLFIPEPEISPLQQAKQRGKKRRRASGGGSKQESGEPSEW
ncbi:MAG: transcriptional regulator [Desulfurivibrio sp.]|nr:transcriptional regulator [Desulfurivibrio sp.]